MVHQPRETALAVVFSAIKAPSPSATIFYSSAVFDQKRESLLRRHLPLDDFDSAMLSAVRNQLFGLALVLEAVDSEQLAKDAKEFAKEIHEALVLREQGVG